MKKICFIGGIIMAFVIICFYGKDITESIKVGNFILKEELNEELMDRYLKSKGEEKDQIENHIKTIVIKDMRLDEWSKYLDEIEMTIYNLDIVGNEQDEILISLNLAKSLGALCIYELKSSNYSLINKIEDLTFIEKVKVEKNKKSGKRFLVLDETLDERVGAYFIDRFTRGFVERNCVFEEVFRQSRDYESYYYERWIDPSKESSKWYRLNEKNTIEYNFKDSGEITIDVNRVLKKSEGLNGTSNTIPESFKEVENKDYNIKYSWNEEYNKFIIGKGKIIATGEEVFILEDTSKTVDYLLNLGEKYYKVINKNMKIKYVKENEINITKDK